MSVAVASKRVYGIEERGKALAALKANDHNVLATADQLGIPESTLRRFIEQAERNDELARQIRAVRDSKGDDLARSSVDTAWAAMTVVNERIGEASARDAAVVYGIMVDKYLVLTGQPTQIHATAPNPVLAQYTPDQLRAMRAALARPVGPVVDALPALPAGERVETDAERAGESGGGGERRLTLAVQQPADGREADAGLAGEPGRGDGLVVEDGPQECGERAD